MESGEARATWQRMANRCSFHEDVTIAPKLACSSLSQPQHDSNGRGVNGAGQPVLNFAPYAWNQVNSDVIPHDTKWWLQSELNSTYLEDSLEQPNSQGKTGENVVQNPTCRSGSVPGSKYDLDIEGNIHSIVPPPQRVSTAFMKHDYRKVEALKAVENAFQQSVTCKADLDEYLYEEELVDGKAVEQLMSDRLLENYFAIKPEWKEAKKSEPWWQIVDKDDLTLLITQRSLCQVENCDLPRPQKIHASIDPPPCHENCSENRTPTKNFERSGHCGSLTSTDYMLRTLNSCSIDGQPQPFSKVNLSGKVEKWNDHTPSTTTMKSRECNDAHEDDRNKSQLLKALCHSQTRARKAEIAAQKAQNEKEHIVKLFFRQASHLFAYKQWFQLLQLESLCLQMKIRENQISSLLPDLPWMSLKWPEMGRTNHDGPSRKGKKGKKCRTCRYLFAFAIGFSLASAGLLLGMTFGWLPVVL